MGGVSAAQIKSGTLPKNDSRQGRQASSPRVAGNARALSATGQRQLEGFDRDLEHAVALMAEQVVGRNDVIQFVLMGDQQAQVDAP